MKRVLVLSPHPDDEAIGCGGALRCHIENGDLVQVIFLTSGEKGVRGQNPVETAARREDEAASAAKVLGYEKFEFWREPDGALEATSRLAARLDDVLAKWRPQIVYVPHQREGHRDHRAACRLAARALGARTSRPVVFLYEVWTPLQKIGHVLDISAQIEVKAEAIRAHRSQCAIMRFDEAARGLARYRGEMHSWPGGPYAEVFGTL